MSLVSKKILGVMLTASLLIISCKQKPTEENRFVGLWRTESVSTEMGVIRNELSFSDDGKCKNTLFGKNSTEKDALSAQGTYNVIEGEFLQLTLQVESNREVYKYKYKFTVADSLILSDGDNEMLYKRVKK